MENKVKMIVRPCKKEEYSIKITFKDKEEMIKFLNKKDQEKKELAELRLQNEKFKEEHQFIEDLHNYFETESLQELKNNLAENVRQGEELSKIVDMIEHQLKEKDKEIEKLNIQIGALQKNSIRKDNVILMKNKEIVDIKSELTHKKYLLKSNTKQVCEKIRKDCYFLNDYNGWLVDEEFLDQIEKGD